MLALRCFDGAFSSPRPFPFNNNCAWVETVKFLHERMKMKKKKKRKNRWEKLNCFLVFVNVENSLWKWKVLAPFNLRWDNLIIGLFFFFPPPNPCHLLRHHKLYSICSVVCLKVVDIFFNNERQKVAIEILFTFPSLLKMKFNYKTFCIVNFPFFPSPCASFYRLSVSRKKNKKKNLTFFYFAINDFEGKWLNLYNLKFNFSCYNLCSLL